MINILVALAGTLYGSYTDLKTGYFPDWASHSMIILGFIWTLFNYEFNQLIWIWGVAAVVFGVGYLLYIFGQIGGGDVKLFTAIVLLIPYYGHEVYPFILPVYILSMLIYMLVMPIQYSLKLWTHKKKVENFDKKFRQVALLELILIGFGIYWFMKFGNLGFLIIPLMISVLVSQ